MAGSVQLFFMPGQGYVIEISSDLTNWTDLYTQARVAELGIGQERKLAAE